MSSVLWLGIVSLAGLLYGCAAAPAPTVASPLPSGALNSNRIDHVIILAIDGLKQETLLSYLRSAGGKRKGGFHDLLGARSDDSGIVLTKGVAVQKGTTVFPSFTYPSWTSMFTGVYPGTHGIT